MHKKPSTQNLKASVLAGLLRTRRGWEANDFDARVAREIFFSFAPQTGK